MVGCLCLSQIYSLSLSLSLFYVKLTRAFSPYGPVHEQKGEGKEREKGNVWLVVPFTVSSVFVSLYLPYSKLTNEKETMNRTMWKESL